MPKINYSDMPYEKKYSTGEKKVEKHSFYCPDKDYEETEEQYRGYYTMDYFGLKIEDISKKNIDSEKPKIKLKQISNKK